MATFLVETYLSPAAAGEPDATIDRAKSAAAQLAAAGHSIAYLRSLFLPDDETCLLLFEADGAGLVRTLTEQAGLDPDRVSLADDRGTDP